VVIVEVVVVVLVVVVVGPFAPPLLYSSAVIPEVASITWWLELCEGSS